MLNTIDKLSVTLTAADLMSREVVTVPLHMPAMAAAKLMLAETVHGVPVVDESNRCVGIFSVGDFARFAQACLGHDTPLATCPFQLRHRRRDGAEVTLCTLAPGTCSLQTSELEGGIARNVCGGSHEIVVDWQLLSTASAQTDRVEQWMTSEPLTVPATASIRECASRMLKAHVHRLIVTDDDGRVQGILSSMDLLAAISGCLAAKLPPYSTEV